MRAPQGRVRTLVWTAPLAVVLANLAAAGTTLVPVELVHITTARRSISM
ncbi:hypothetical protein ABZO35_31190 [Burkholderia pseudomallei]|nr:hypothetical protein [Burkholderia pseudomallei]